MIPFNRASFDGDEISHLVQAIRDGHTAGNGPFTKRAEAILTDMHGGSTTLLTTSCTHALEMAARLLDLQPEDEVIVPAYTFVSTASAFMWNGAKPVFADIRPDTLNIDPVSVEALITDRTRAICIVHYAGVGAEPDRFAEIAERHGLVLIEDNAHGLGATYQGKTLGTFGALSTLSFHETKNITCGEGGALVINDPALVERAEILREKGTDRSKFLRSQVDKYTWVDVGSSWVLSDLLAAVLVGQLDRFPEIHRTRKQLWATYAAALSDWASKNHVRMPTIPSQSDHPAHLFYLLLPSKNERDRFIAHMKARNILTVFHYQSLHTSPVGLKIGVSLEDCPSSDMASECLVRLPIFVSLSADSSQEQKVVIEAALEFSTLD